MRVPTGCQYAPSWHLNCVVFGSLYYTSLHNRKGFFKTEKAPLAAISFRTFPTHYKHFHYVTNLNISNSFKIIIQWFAYSCIVCIHFNYATKSRARIRIYFKLFVFII